MYRPIVRRFAFFHTLFLSLIDHIVCTVTCRQFPNLTFAPRKTCIECSNLTLHSYHATAILSINQGLWDCKYFFCEIVFFLYFFSYKAILGVYMVGNTKELSCISAITLDFPAIYLGHILPGSRHGKHRACIIGFTDARCLHNGFDKQIHYISSKHCDRSLRESDR